MVLESHMAEHSVTTATQMLESIVHSSRPTRAETSDVASAIIDGTEAIMLSAEIAAGAYPVEIVTTMNRIAHGVEHAGFTAVLEKRLTLAPSIVESVTESAAEQQRHIISRLWRSLLNPVLPLL
jgi:pyruvate kinase